MCKDEQAPMKSKWQSICIMKCDTIHILGYIVLKYIDLNNVVKQVLHRSVI